MVIRPYRVRPECKDAAYCYRCSVVSVSLGLLEITTSCAKTADRDAVWGVDLGGRKEPLGKGSDTPQGKEQFLTGAPAMRPFVQIL